ncbi:Hpt domain-containing protein [Thioalkalivibrio sp. ALJ16]|uniref:hybrid sensor histidine kinase/response regulator n=1 Tax=Thioalkalivibrio sp. ALJ16 TaxID=1158762 RepID=UPI00037780E4|nr:Hpt domain-containing protein [Thioalkalivibrio sp. ALJ16]
MASSALNWVRDELDKLFVEVQDALRRYSEDSSCHDCLAEARSRIQQIRNTLVMVQVESVVLILDEMLQVLGQLEQAEDPSPSAAEPLLRAALQLPDYLENEGDGELPSPMILVPLLNELRSSRGASLLLDVAALMPDPQDVDDARVGSGGEVLEPAARVAALQQARRGFQRDLLELVRSDDPATAAARMQATARTVGEAVPAGDARRLFWVAGAVLEAVAEGGVEADTDVRRLIGRVDRELGRYLNLLAAHVETAGDGSEPEYAAPEELVKTLLFHVACATSEGEQTRAVREVFGLDRLNLEDDSGSVGRSVYDNLRQALEDDLAEVRERLDVIMRSPVRDPEGLATLREQVERIGSTLSLLGLDAGQDHTDALAASLTPERAGAADEQVDMVLAEHLLALESLLESGLRRRSSSPTPQAEFDRALAAAVYKEALVDVRRVRDTFLGFLDPSAEATGDGMDEARAGLRRIEGAMAMSGFEALHALLGPLIRHLDSRAGMQAGELDEGEVEALAEVLSSIEVALESSGQPWRELDSVHERGIAALQRIGAISGGERDDVDAGAAADRAEPEAEPDLPELAHATTDAEPGAAYVPEPESDAPAGTPVTPARAAGPLPARGRDSLPFDDQVLAEQVRGPDVDPEILEIFLEEADEEVASLGEHFPRWQANPGDLDTLTVIRRSFHTLKGSGRLAGALRLGEFSWAVESFLNGLLDSGYEADHATLQVIEDAIAVLPGLVAEVRDDTAAETPVLDIALRLRALAGGEAEPEPEEEAEVPEGATEELEALARTLDELDVVDDVAAPEDEPVSADHEDLTGEMLQEPGAFVPDLPPEAMEPDAVPEPGEPESGLEFTADAGGTPPPAAALEPGTAPDEPEPLDLDALELPADALEVAETALEPAAEEDAPKADEPPEVTEFEQVPDFAEINADLALPEEAEEVESDLPEAAEEVEPAAAARMEIDPQLWQVFAAEAQVHLLTLRGWLEESQWRPDRIPNHDLERALHTLNGSARTADIRGIYSVCGPFERLIRIHRDMEWALPAEAVALLRQIEVYVASAVGDDEPDPAKLLDPPPWAPEVYALLDQATAEQLLRAAEDQHEEEAAEPEFPDAEEPAAPAAVVEAPVEPEPAEAATDEIDWEFAEVFIEEARDILEAAFAALHGWREAGGRPGPDQNTFQRELHTLKGSARMAGFTVVGAIAHALESALSVETETGLEPRDGFFQLAERALTDVQRLVERGVGAWQMDESASESLPALRNWAAGDSDESPAADEPLLAVDAEEAGDAPGSGPEETAPAAPEADQRSHEPPESEGRRIQDQVRMDADVLDSLVNNAGELATFHRRFEQTVGRVEGQVDELERTISRLRDQLRKLEIETEAQILFRVEEESGEEALDFDPLEMDRYSGIQQLSRALAESVSDLEALKQEVYDELQNAGGILLQQRRVGTDLQDQLMRQRMVRFARMAPRLRRVVRQAGEDLGKPVRVEFTGQGAELDRALLERLVAPLEHLLRNAIAHGIESPEERERARKPAQGQIDVSLEQSGSEIRLQVTDDGKGIDAEAIRARAVERGLIAADAEVSDAQALQLILQSGFSTASEVSQVAGRGVGLDVVNSDVKQLGGTLDIQSTPGRGSRFTMRLPFTLAISQALLVQVGEETFAVPMASVEGVVRARAEEIDARDDAAFYNYIGQDYQVRGLGDLMGVESQAGVDHFPEHPFPLLLVRADDQRVALRIDGLLGSQEVVVKSVGPVLSRIPGVAGATLQGDGSVMLILDLSMLVRFAAAAAALPDAVQPAHEPATARRIMVVDDSITIRKVTARLLARHGYDVVTARDGLDAVGLLDERRPQLILLDVEMPRMDGFEFAAHVRDHPDFAQVPIIMITSRSGTKHRERADRLGVNAYLGKPYLENDLLAAIREQLQEVPA